MTVAVVAALGGLGWLLFWLPGGSSHPEKTVGATGVTGAAPGRVLFMSSSGIYGLASPDGTGVRELVGLGTHSVSGGAYAFPSFDGRYAVATDGTVIAVDGTTPSLQSANLDVATGAQQLDYDNPFTDDDQDVVIFHGGPSGYASTNASVVLVRWRSGAQVGSLGAADQYAGGAGDPQAPGAFLSVALPATSEGEGDEQVELRDVGKQPVVLATAAVVDRALGQPTSRYFVLSPYPDPAGDKVAITVNTIQPGSGPSVGVIVVDRSGHVLGSLSGLAAPQGGYAVTWSPDGRSLLYVATGNGGQEVGEWMPGSSPLFRALPDASKTAGVCIWSADASQILCEATDLQTQTTSWVSGAARGGPLGVNPGPGSPVEFLGSRP